MIQPMKQLDTKEIKLDQKVRSKKLEEENLMRIQYEKKKSFKKFKMEKKLKIKPGKKHLHQEFLLDNSKPQAERLTTQPELTH